MKTHRQRIKIYLTGHPGRCDDCLSGELNIRPRQAVNTLCSQMGCGILRTKGDCGSCGKHKMLNELTTTPQPAALLSRSNNAKTLSNGSYVREEDLRMRFNVSLIDTIGIAAEDYYGRLDFDHLLRLKEGLVQCNF